jgi:hypothetical protein
MTTFNLEAPAGVWFDVEGGGRVCLRTMTAEAMRAIDKQSTTKRVEYKRIDGKAERFEVLERDEELSASLFWDFIIVDWSDFYAAEGIPILPTRGNKTLLMQRSQSFAALVGESLKVLAAGEAKAEEERAKN